MWKIYKYKPRVLTEQFDPDDTLGPGSCICLYSAILVIQIISKVYICTNLSSHEHFDPDDNLGPGFSFEICYYTAILFHSIMNKNL